MKGVMFRFKEFTVLQERAAMKVTTETCLFGAWVASHKNEKNITVLDIGSGTGLLSLMLAQKWNKARIDAIEIEPGAFEDSSLNFENSPWRERLTVIPGDAATYDFSIKYDVICSNPPFYEKELASPHPGRELAHHGSGLGSDDLLKIIVKNLAAAGRAYILFPFKREKELLSKMEKAGLHPHQLLYVRQTTRHSAFRFLVEAGLEKVETIKESEVTIRDADGKYSPAFISYLKDYYLYL